MADSQPSSKKTRSVTRYDLLGHPLPEITGARLPTTRQVLRRFLYASQQKKSRSEAFEATLNEVNSFWDKARIKTLGKVAQKRKLTKVWESWRGLQKSKQHAAPERRDTFTQQLDLLWNIAATDWKEEITSNRLLTPADKEEDIAFFRTSVQLVSAPSEA